MEALTMSQKERARLTIMTSVTDGELTQVQAAELMGGATARANASGSGIRPMATHA
jgi:hypothetical protein